MATLWWQTDLKAAIVNGLQGAIANVTETSEEVESLSKEPKVVKIQKEILEQKKMITKIKHSMEGLKRGMEGTDEIINELENWAIFKIP